MTSIRPDDPLLVAIKAELLGSPAMAEATADQINNAALLAVFVMRRGVAMPASLPANPSDARVPVQPEYARDRVTQEMLSAAVRACADAKVFLTVGEILNIVVATLQWAPWIRNLPSCPFFPQIEETK